MRDGVRRMQSLSRTSVSQDEEASVRLLVIEDNRHVADVLARSLREYGYAVDLAPGAQAGYREAVSLSYDAILLDVMLDDECGIEVCRMLRRQRITTPILMLTVLSTTEEKIKALDAGADDYLTKPYDLAELLARLRALLRRGKAGEAAVLRYDDLELDLLKRHVKRGQRRIELRPKEFALLEFLMRNPERALSRTLIGEHVWDMNFDSDSNVIEVYVSNLRRKLGEPQFIETLPGVGYRLAVASLEV
jgi:DNA-binding response OmpR family regulator